MTEPSARPWRASAPHPQNNQCVITNAQGRVVTIATNPVDAECICEAAELADAITKLEEFGGVYGLVEWADGWSATSEDARAGHNRLAVAIIALARKMRGGQS